MKLYDQPASGNCLKCRILLRQLGVPYEMVVVDLFRGETRTPEHFARNPDGRVPVLEHDDGATIPESGAILLYLAEGTPLLPADRLARARVHAWMFFEQNQIEATLASARFLAAAGRDRDAPEAFADKVTRGRAALETLERGLADGRAFAAGEAYTVADIALYGYVHCAADAGADPRAHGQVAAWLARVEGTEGFVNDLAPFPAHVTDRPI
jgi:glutathione S-transferase